MSADDDTLLLVSTDQFLSWLEEKKKAEKMSDRDMAKAARLSHSTMSNLRRDGSRDVKLSTVARAADVFGYRLALVRRDK